MHLGRWRFATRDVRLDFHLYQMGRIGKLRHLDHGRYRSNVAEQFLVWAPDLGLRCDVGDIHPGTYHLLQCHSGYLQSLQRNREG